MKITFERVEMMSVMQWYMNIFLEVHDLMPECNDKDNVLKMVNELNALTWKDVCDSMKEMKQGHGVSVGWNDSSIMFSIKPEMMIDLITVYPTKEVAKMAAAMFYSSIAIEKIGVKNFKAAFNAIKDLFLAMNTAYVNPELSKAIDLIKAVDINQIMVNITATQAKWDLLNNNEEDDE